MDESVQRARDRSLLRATGVAAILGGLLWVAAAVLHSLEPPGCIGLECATRSMREATPLVSALGAAASLFTLGGMAGLVIIGRRSGRHRGLANTGLIAAAVGFAVLLLGAVVQAVFFGGDMPWMPFVVIPGLVGVIVGFVLIGMFVLRSGVLPTWLGVLLVASATLLLGANEQTAAVLLAIPFGVAITAVGVFLWANADRVLVTGPLQR